MTIVTQITKKRIVSWFEDLNVIYWVLFEKNQIQWGSPICGNKEVNNSSREEAIKALEKALEYLDKGEFTLIASNSLLMRLRPFYRIDFEVSMDTEETPPEQTTITDAPIMDAATARSRSENGQKNKRRYIYIVNKLLEATQCGKFDLHLEFIICDEEKKYYEQMGYEVRFSEKYGNHTVISW